MQIPKAFIDGEIISGLAAFGTLVMIRMTERGDHPFRISIFLKSLVAWSAPLLLIAWWCQFPALLGAGLLLVPPAGVLGPAYTHYLWFRIHDVTFLRCVWWIVGTWGIFSVSIIGVAAICAVFVWISRFCGTILQ